MIVTGDILTQPSDNFVGKRKENKPSDREQIEESLQAMSMDRMLVSEFTFCNLNTG